MKKQLLLFFSFSCVSKHVYEKNNVTLLFLYTSAYLMEVSQKS